MLKRFLRFRKLEDEDRIPKLKFGVKLRKSGYIDSKLHPLLEGLLHYLYALGRLDPYREAASEIEDLAARDLIQRLKEGRNTSLDAALHTPRVIITVLEEYLKKLPKCLWHKIKLEDYMRFAQGLPVFCDSDQAAILKKRDSITQSQRLLAILTPWSRGLTVKLLLCLHALCRRSEDDLRRSATFRVARLLSGALAVNGAKMYKIPDETRYQIEASVQFMVAEAPNIVNIQNPHFDYTLTIHNIRRIT